ncbi:hypothetical protein ABZP36_009800 [Zizania latifolia]
MARNPCASICLADVAVAVLLLSSCSVHAAQDRRQAAERYDVPVQTLVYRPAPAAAVSTAAYEPFQLCMGCRCCSPSNSSSCVDTRCCYGINCNIPGKPFGFCAFTPLTCDCGANNCTNQP